MWEIYLTLLLCVCLLCLARWQTSLMAILLVGFTQDSVRKLIEGEPRVFVLMAGVVFAVGLLSLLARKGVSGLVEPFTHWTTRLQTPLMFFGLILLLQFCHSLLRFGNPLVSMIGLLSYIAPFLAVVLGYCWATRLDEVRKYLTIYVGVGVVVAVSVFLSFLGYQWSIFNEVGAGLKIYDMGTVLVSHAGIMRTGEIAAWHIAMAACFMLILFLTSQKSKSETLVAICIIGLMIAVFLTGRRKMFMMFSLFIAFYIFGMAYFRRGVAIGYVLTGGLGVMIGWLVIEVLFPGGYGESLNNYVARGTTVYSDASGRFIELGINPLYWAYNRVGILGGGLGIASQGASYYGSIDIAGGAGEGGLGKIMVELGLPGLLVIFWLGLASLGYVYNIIKLAASQTAEPRWLVFSLGLVVLLIVNLLTFSVATQLYGDLFILILLGTIAGFLLAVPKMIVLAADANDSVQPCNLLMKTQ